MSIFETINMPLFNGGVFRTDLLAETHYFSCTFNTGSTPKDKISRAQMQTTGLAAGRVSYHGGPYGINEPAVDTNGLFGCHAFTQSIPYSTKLDEVFDASKLPGSPEYPDPLSGNNACLLDLETGTDYYYGVFSGIAGTTYTFSQWIKLGTSTTCSYAIYDISNSAWIIEQTPYIGVSYTEFKRVAITFTLPAGCTSFRIYPKRYMDPTDIGTSLHYGANLTDTALLMPYVRTEGSALAIPENFSDADQGYKFDNEGQLFTALNGTDGTDAQGTLIVKWRPMFSSGDLTGTVNILTANDEASSFLFFDADNDLLKITDGTNTSQVACSPVADTEYEITAQYDETNGMVVSLDGLAGTTVAFAGMFPNADDLSFFWEADVPQYVKLLSIEKDSGL